MSRAPQHAPAQARQGVDTGPVRHALRQSSRPLQPHESAPLERSFGFDLAHLRIHDNPAGRRALDALDARAATIGPHILVGADGVSEGRVDPALLAHEVAHALQQPRAVSSDATAPLARSGDAAERDADRAAQAVMQGDSASIATAGGAQLACKGKRRGLTGWAIDALLDDDDDFDRLLEHPLDTVIEGTSNAAGATAEGFKEDASDLVDLGEGAVDLGARQLDNMRKGADQIRSGGESVEQWLQDKQVENSHRMFDDAASVKDEWYGPLAHAYAWGSDKTSEFSTGVAKGAVTLGTGVLAAATDPVGTLSGVGKVASEANKVVNPLALLAEGAGKMIGGAIVDKPVSANEAFNPFAEGKPLRQMGEGLIKPYAKSVGEGRYLDASGRFVFDALSMLVGSGEGNAATKTGSKTAPLVKPVTKTAPLVDPLAKTVEVVNPLGKTAEVVDPLARTANVVDPLARTADVVDPLAKTADVVDPLAKTSELAPAAPKSPYPTLITPESPNRFNPAVRERQMNKAWDWLDQNLGDVLQPPQRKPPPTELPPAAPRRRDPMAQRQEFDRPPAEMLPPQAPAAAGVDPLANTGAQPMPTVPFPAKPGAKTMPGLGPPETLPPRQRPMRPYPELLPPGTTIEHILADEKLQAMHADIGRWWQESIARDPPVRPPAPKMPRAATVEEAIAQAKKLLGMK